MLSCSAAAEAIETQGRGTDTYDGREFSCRRPVSSKNLPGGRGWTSSAFEYATPDKKLGVRVTWKFYDDFDAAEYVPELYALTDEKTGVVTDLASFTFVHDDGKPKWKGLATRVRTLRGDKCNAELFTPDVRWCCDRNWLKFGAYGRSSDSGRELADKVGQAVALVTAAMAFLSVLICFIAAVSIAHALLSSVRVREREFALMRAIGASRSDIAGIVLGEAALIGLCGGAGGITSALLAASAVRHAFLRAPIPGLDMANLNLFQFTPSLILLSLAVAVLSAVLGAIAPAAAAARSAPARLLAG